MVRIGDRGQVVSTLRPQGFVQVNGKRYDARAEFGAIEAGQEVVVIRGDLQGLVVRRVESGAADRQLPDHGQPVHSSFGELLDQQGRQETAEREQWLARRPRWRAARRRYAVRSGVVLGLAFSAAGLALAWEYVERTSTAPRMAAAAVAGFGIVWATLVFLTFDAFLQRQLSSILPRLNESVYDRVALLSTTLALAGTTSGVLMGVQSLGAVGGTLIAVATTLALGSIVPLVIALNVPPEEE